MLFIVALIIVALFNRVPDLILLMMKHNWLVLLLVIHLIIIGFVKRRRRRSFTVFYCSANPAMSIV